MGCRIETIEINGHEYSVTQWPAEESFENKFLLTKTFGSPLSLILGSIEEDEEVDDESDLKPSQAQALSDGLSKLFELTTPKEMVHILKTFVMAANRGGNEITSSKFTEYFSGDDMGDAYKVFAFVVKVNYGNLLKGQKVEDLLAKVQEKL